MHEFSLAQNIADMITASAQENGITHIRKVSVVVGQWSAVMPEALQTSFQVIAGVSGPVLEGAAMDITLKEARARCLACQTEYPADEQGLICPACGAAAQLVAGAEFYVDSYEGD